MAFYVPPIPPRSGDSTLNRWLRESFSLLANYINYTPVTSQAFDPVQAMEDLPDKLQEGLLVYSAVNLVPDGGPNTGFNYWDGTGWTKL